VRSEKGSQGYGASSLDLATPEGRLQFHVLAALWEFERARIQERVCAGLTRAMAQKRTLDIGVHELGPRDVTSSRGSEQKPY
jgi:DNA invertase Pin-like site-specific DNA recombinase